MPAETEIRQQLHAHNMNAMIKGATLQFKARQKALLTFDENYWLSALHKITAF